LKYLALSGCSLGKFSKRDRSVDRATPKDLAASYIELVRSIAARAF
jgi:hypothetical protein